MKTIALLLLLANCVLSYYLYSRNTGYPAPPVGRTDLNADKLRVVPLAALGKRNATISSVPRVAVAVPSAKPEASALTCLEWGKIEAADAERARKRLTLLGTAVDQYTEQRLEEPTRFWVYIGDVPDATEATRILSRLKQAGIKDAFSQPDHSISLALYASEDLAKGYQAQLLAKGFYKVAIEPRALQVKEVSFLIRDPDPKLAAQLSETKSGEFKASQVRPVACPIEAGSAGVAKPG
jgi:SPOR domain